MGASISALLTVPSAWKVQNIEAFQFVAKLPRFGLIAMIRPRIAMIRPCHSGKSVV